MRTSDQLTGKNLETARHEVKEREPTPLSRSYEEYSLRYLSSQLYREDQPQSSLRSSASVVAPFEVPHYNPTLYPYVYEAIDTSYFLHNLEKIDEGEGFPISADVQHVHREAHRKSLQLYNAVNRGMERILKDLYLYNAQHVLE